MSSTSLYVNQKYTEPHIQNLDVPHGLKTANTVFYSSILFYSEISKGRLTYQVSTIMLSFYFEIFFEFIVWYWAVIRDKQGSDPVI